MTFSRHARNRMRHLKLTPADVEAVVAQPELSDVGDGGKVRHYGIAGTGYASVSCWLARIPTTSCPSHERRR